MARPNVILAGAQKCGTTSLCRFLAKHPHCLVTEPKEPHFFSRAENISRLYRYDRYFRAARGAHRVFVDGSTSYMADPAVAPRIFACLGGGVRIIFVLRDPSARAYSGLIHMAKRGHDRRTADEVFLELPDEAEAALGTERALIERASASNRIASRPYRNDYDDVLWNYRYVGNSLYSSLVRGYIDRFGPERILVLLLEDIITDVATVRQALGAFLQVDPELFPHAIGRDNPTYRPDLSTPWGRLIEQARWIKRGNLTLVRPSEIAASPLRSSAAIEEKLDRIFEPEVDYWSRHVGRDLRAIGWGRRASIARMPATSSDWGAAPADHASSATLSGIEKRGLAATGREQSRR
jgi:hypothetical protein